MSETQFQDITNGWLFTYFIFVLPCFKTFFKKAFIYFPGIRSCDEETQLKALKAAGALFTIKQHTQCSIQMLNLFINSNFIPKIEAMLKRTDK